MRFNFSKIDRSTWIIASIFIIAGIFSWTLFFKSYGQQDSVSVHDFPRKIDDWEAIDLPISEDEYAILETRNVFARKYTDSKGFSIYLMVVYSQHNRKVSHPPEICFTGSGAAILNTQYAYLHIDKVGFVIKANKILMEIGNMQQIVYYWFKVGDTLTTNYWKQQGLIAAKTILGKPASSALIRIAATVGPEGMSEASSRIEAFAHEATPLLFKFLP